MRLTKKTPISFTGTIVFCNTDVSTPPGATAKAFTESGWPSQPFIEEGHVLTFRLHRSDRGLDGLRGEGDGASHKYVRLGVSREECSTSAIFGNR